MHLHVISEAEAQADLAKIVRIGRLQRQIPYESDQELKNALRKAEAEFLELAREFSCVAIAFEEVLNLGTQEKPTAFISASVYRLRALTVNL